MNEHLDSNSTRTSDARNNSGEPIHGTGAQRERGAAEADKHACPKCGLDTGSRGWRYVYQTH